MKPLLIFSIFAFTIGGVALAEDHTEQVVDYRCLISESGIGAAHPGQTIAGFRKAVRDNFPDDIEIEVREGRSVEFSSLAVVRNGETLFSALVPTGEEGDEATRIVAIETSSPRFRTRDGIGPGSSLLEAEREYGEVMLEYNTENESREVMTFTGPLAMAIHVSFAPALPSLNDHLMAGVYDSEESDSTYHNTTIFHHQAYIDSIRVFDPVPRLQIYRNEIDESLEDFETRKATTGNGEEVLAWYDGTGVLQRLRYTAVRQRTDYYLEDGDLVLVVETDQFEADDGFVYNEYQVYYAAEKSVGAIQSSPTDPRRVDPELPDAANALTVLRKLEALLLNDI